MASQIESLDTLDAGNALQGEARVSLSVKGMMLRAAAFILEITGTNAGINTVGPYDLGRLRLFKGSESSARWAIDLGDLFELEKERNDSGPTIVSIGSGDIELRTRFGNTLLGMLAGNGFHVPQDGPAQLVLDFNSSPGGGRVLNSKASDLSYAVRPKLSPAVAESRLVEWHTTTVLRSSSGQQEVEGIDEENIGMIFLDDPDGVVSRVTVERTFPEGIEPVFDEAPIEAVQREYERTTIPAGSSRFVGVPLMERPTAVESLNTGVNLDLTTSGGSNNIRLVYASMQPPSVSGSGSDVQQRTSKLRSLA